MSPLPHTLRFTRALYILLAIIISCVLSPQKCHAFHSTKAATNHFTLRRSVAVTPKRNLAKLYLDSVNENDSLSDRQKGVLVLLTVPMAWGTFEPAVRLVYQIQPDIPPFLFSLAYYLVATIPLCLLALTERKDKSFPDSTSGMLPILGGLELGTYLFVGNALQVVGLKTVPSDRAAFLLQLTAIFVPLVQSIIAKNLFAIPVKTWAACLIALLGVVLIGADGTNDVSLSSLSLETIQFSPGDTYIMLGALFYTFHCIRLEGYAQKIPSAVALAAAKASTETLWSTMVVVACLVAAQSDHLDFPLFDSLQTAGKDLLQYQESLKASFVDVEVELHLKLATALLWTGIVPIAYTITAQTYGQSRVPPATANLIYTIQPFFTALIAFLLLGETLGVAGYVGGALIGSAVLLVVVGDENGPANKESTANDVKKLV